MRQKPLIGTMLLENGELVCEKCYFPDSKDELQKRLRQGDTYDDEPCDRCGAMPVVPVPSKVLPFWDD
jgi:hypothetical protein